MSPGEVKELCCAAACYGCAKDMPLVRLGGEWHHEDRKSATRVDGLMFSGYRCCEAAAIRDEVLV
jgi:hypothetical protein